jgi:sensor histidine kinase regulating citrate/malate metabolism
LKIAVADTGIGIKGKIRRSFPKIFRQLDGSSTRQYGGTGLVWVSQETRGSAGRHDSSFERSQVGSVFSLLLPVKGSSISAVKLD